MKFDGVNVNIYIKPPEVNPEGVISGIKHVVWQRLPGSSVHVEPVEFVSNVGCQADVPNGEVPEQYRAEAEMFCDQLIRHLYEPIPGDGANGKRRDGYRIWLTLDREARGEVESESLVYGLERLISSRYPGMSFAKLDANSGTKPGASVIAPRYSAPNIAQEAYEWVHELLRISVPAELADLHLRRRAVEVHGDVLADMFSKGGRQVNARCIEGLPRGAKLVHVSYTTWNNIVRLTFVHPSFDVVNEGCYTPTQEVVYQQETNNGRGQASEAGGVEAGHEERQHGDGAWELRSDTLAARFRRGPVHPA